MSPYQFVDQYERLLSEKGRAAGDEAVSDFIVATKNSCSIIGGDKVDDKTSKSD